MAVIAAQDLNTFAAAILASAGFSRDDAAQMADLLVWANLRGVASHGVLRLPRYVEMLQQGEVLADHDISVVKRFGAVMVLDAGKAPGAAAMNRATTEAANLAQESGIGWCGVRRTSHAGAIGYFVAKLAKLGLVGIAMTASKPLMSYYGAKGEALSTNPLAIGVPSPDGAPPLILDMSTAAVALGKIMAAKDSCQSIPLGWGIDATGADTTDPHKVAAVLPMAGAKGSGLSLMIEILCSVLVGNPNIAPALSGGEGGGFNGMVLAIDPAAFGDAGGFLAEIGNLVNAIHGLDPVAEGGRVLLPGERGHESELLRRDQGVPIPEGTVKRLIALAGQLEVPVPAAFL
ncbi:dehydrogenase [Sphingobium sp. GW456-12-10-14-TSB1]|uniref:Ldh family oxidoreductase n=1 Tax=unclassified Sphingobium TaxID=2611147 RepID=UPI000A37A007|nr:Ldh family oxidoreductase [Sphingobium sp. GW456-12-10-14-TSB1]OUC54188.1 dehydrogenase [Sphingobium sp. GW456-12-10-14-TSB1]